MKIDARTQSIRDIFLENEFIVPGYQRPYSWDVDHCERLLVDLSDFLDSRGEKHEQYFLGSIVVHPARENTPHLLEIIDGQQRLTTMLILFKVLKEKARTYTFLDEIMFKKDGKTGRPKEGEPRLESEVKDLDKDSEKTNLCAILDGRAEDLGKDNRFLLNYNCLNEKVKDWWNGKNSQQCDDAIEFLLNDVIMLPIVCESKERALTILFETINNRGKDLTDADIVKAKMYGAVSGQEERDKFTDRWSDIRDPREMLKVYMHISRAKNNDSQKEIGLLRYLEKNHLENPKKPLSKNWEGLMGTLEKCDYITESWTLSGEDMQAAHDICWGIMSRYPNEYWKYPLFVFLDRHMKRDDSGFALLEEKYKEYAILMENTMRYFLIKALVHNTLNVVKDTTYKVCAALARGEDYIEKYENNVRGDRKEFNKKLGERDLKRCDKCMAFLCASLNKNQNRLKYAKFLSSRAPQMEHILPVAWNHYDKWTPKTHAEALNKIGNLMPLEKKRNSTASNEFFLRKKKVYKNSEVQDALDLSGPSPATWHPDDFAQRQEKMLERLRNFFAEFKRP